MKRSVAAAILLCCFFGQNAKPYPATDIPAGVISHASNPLPHVALRDPESLLRLRQLFQAGQGSQNSSIQNAINVANEAMSTPPLSVTDSPKLAPSGDPHDYISFSSYAWPNPSTLNGLPYIIQDGHPNPEEKQYSDRHNLQTLISAVYKLAVGYYITQNEAYADKAISLLNTWFLDPTTRMNPNLNYAQIVPGKNNNQGAPSGLIDTHSFSELMDGISLLEQSPEANVSFKSGIKNWFSQYEDWLQNSQLGKKASEMSNNQGTWYHLQLACIAHFLGNDSLAKSVLKEEANQLTQQIAPDGSQPKEIIRTNGFNYSSFNLNGLFRFANLGKGLGVDLWHQIDPNTGKPLLQQALDYLLPFAEGQQKWPYQQISPWDRQLFKYLLNQSYQVYRDPKYKDAVSKLQPFTIP